MPDPFEYPPGDRWTTGDGSPDHRNSRTRRETRQYLSRLRDQEFPPGWWRPEKYRATPCSCACPAKLTTTQRVPSGVWVPDLFDNADEVADPEQIDVPLTSSVYVSEGVWYLTHFRCPDCEADWCWALLRSTKPTPKRPWNRPTDWGRDPDDRYEVLVGDEGPPDADSQCRFDSRDETT